MSLSQPEAFARIRLLRSPNIGPVSYRALLARFGNGEAAIEALPDLGSRGKTPYRPAAKDRIDREIEGKYINPVFARCSHRGSAPVFGQKRLDFIA